MNLPPPPRQVGAVRRDSRNLTIAFSCVSVPPPPHLRRLLLLSLEPRLSTRLCMSSQASFSPPPSDSRCFIVRSFAEPQMAPPPSPLKFKLPFFPHLEIFIFPLLVFISFSYDSSPNNRQVRLYRRRRLERERFPGGVRTTSRDLRL